MNDKDALPVTLIQFDATAARSYFTVGNLECTAQVAPKPTSATQQRTSVALRACRLLSEKKTTSLKPTTKFTEELKQTEKIITEMSRNSGGVKKASAKPTTIEVHTIRIKSNKKKIEGNITSNSSNRSDKSHNGVTISMSILAVIVISASVVLVWAIIAVIVIVKRKRRDSKRDRPQEREQENEEGTEMCILFRPSKREVSRPTIELRRDSYDSYDSVPTPALEYTQHTGFRQPITTHITLDYARAKKKKNNSAYFCS